MSMMDQRDSLSLSTLYHDPDYPEKNGRIPHSDGETYTTITRIGLEHGAVYIQQRVTEIDPKWYQRPLHWLIDRL